MGLFDRLRGGRGGGNRRGTLDRGSHHGDLTHLEQFVATRRGVEGYVEPRTSVTETTTEVGLSSTVPDAETCVWLAALIGLVSLETVATTTVSFLTVSV